MRTGYFIESCRELARFFLTSVASGYSFEPVPVVSDAVFSEGQAIFPTQVRAPGVNAVQGVLQDRSLVVADDATVRFKRFAREYFSSTTD
jgi:hypothetical protein